MAQPDEPGLFEALGLFLVWCALLAWHLHAASLSCPLAAVLLAALALIIALSSGERALLRRQVLVRQYLAPESGLTRWLLRPTLLLTWQGTKALALAFVLMLMATGMGVGQWLLLLIDALVFATILVAADRLLGHQINARYRAALVRHWAHRINALALWIALVALSYFSAHEDLRGLPLGSVLDRAAGQVEIGCDALALVGRLGSASEGLLWWSAGGLLEGLERPEHLLLAWVGFLAGFGVSFLPAWAYSRALAGTLARPWRLMQPGDDPARAGDP